LVCVPLLFLDCGVSVTSDKSRLALRRHEIKLLLYSLDTYKSENGALPTSLEELRKVDARARSVTFPGYDYDPNGIPVADGSLWLLTVQNPLEKNQIVVGKLPFEIDIKTPRQK
jgi:hypothetical protein